jgi:hypothetical protein
MNDEERPLMIFEVDISEIRPVTWRVEAQPTGPKRLSGPRDGQGDDISGVDYVFGDVVDVRNAS